MPAHTATSIAQALRNAGIDASVRGNADAAVHSVAPADTAGAGDITFYRGDRFAAVWADGPAGTALVSHKHADAYTLASDSKALILVPDADLAFIVVLRLFAPKTTPRSPGVHPTAVVSPTATIDPSAHVGPFCVIESGATIGAGAVLIASVHVGADASIGDGSVLHPQARVLDRCVVGRRCLLHSGATLGADGFGFRPDGKGALAKVPQIGTVLLHDDVEVGANTCIDRATMGTTTIGRGTKLDNHVQIGHNCSIGNSCVICGHAAIAGSVTIGDGVTIGGSVGIADGLTIGTGASVAAQAGVINDIPPGEVWIGAPAGPASDMRRNIAAFRRLAETLADLKKKLR